MKNCLAPIVDENASTLILGSLPGDESLRMKQYYAHPRNHFWGIMAAVLNEPTSDDYAERVQMLLRHGIALWDVLSSARREGSLDGNIRDARANDLPGFLARHRGICFVIFNGATAYRCFKKSFPQLDIAHAVVRSSSPVPSRGINSAEQKAEQWARVWAERHSAGGRGRSL